MTPCNSTLQKLFESVLVRFCLLPQRSCHTVVCLALGVKNLFFGMCFHNAKLLGWSLRRFVRCFCTAPYSNKLLYGAGHWHRRAKYITWRHASAQCNLIQLYRALVWRRAIVSFPRRLNDPTQRRRKGTGNCCNYCAPPWY